MVKQTLFFYRMVAPILLCYSEVFGVYDTNIIEKIHVYEILLETLKQVAINLFYYVTKLHLNTGYLTQSLYCIVCITML